MGVLEQWNTVVTHIPSALWVVGIKINLVNGTNFTVEKTKRCPQNVNFGSLCAHLMSSMPKMLAKVQLISCGNNVLASQCVQICVGNL